jgi:hypothetical protein
MVQRMWEALCPNQPSQVIHIVDTSVSKLSMAEGLILLHLRNGADGDVIAICSLSNIIV